MSEQLRSVRSKVLGVRSSAGPLKNVAISFGDGVTALYGRNGAGKTWALNAVRESFAGHAAAQTHLLVSIPDKTEQQEWFEAVLAQRSSVERWEEEHEGRLLDTGTNRTIALRKWFQEVDRRFPVWYQRPPVSEQMLDELARSQYLALVPTGDSERRWDVWVCIEPGSDDFPVAAAELDRFGQVERTTSALMEVVYGLIDDFGTPEWAELASSVEFMIHECDKALAGMPRRMSEDLKDLLGEMRKASEKSQVGGLENTVVPWLMFAPLNWLVMPVAGWVWQYEAIYDLVDTYSEDSGRFLQGMLDDGLPIPVARVAQVDRIPWVLHDEAADDNVDVLTARRFAVAMASDLPGEARHRDRLTGEPTLPIADSMEEWVRAVESDANAILAGLLQDGPELSLSLRLPHEWVLSEPLEWVSSRGRVSVPISALSTAERRWAQIAVKRALDRVPKEPEDSGRLDDFWPPRSLRYRPADLIMIDEPETALHRAAERHMAAGLDGMTVLGPQVVVATHSPELLNRPEARLVHVRRALDGATTANQMVDTNLEASVAELGMLPSDLIGMYRVFLLVEGEHDEIVVRALLGEVLDSARVKIIPMRGGSKLPSTIESRVLFDMTDAHVVAMLDNVKAGDIETVWQQAEERYLTADAAAAIAYLSTQFKDRKGEEFRWIGEWLSRALNLGVGERLTPFGLAEADIIEYLPVELLAPKAEGKSWADLRAEFESQKNKNFKDWLGRKYKADTSVDNIKRAAAALTEVPGEFISLGHRLREVSSRRP